MRTKVEAVLRVALLLCVVQALRFVFEGLVFQAAGHTWLTDGLVRIVAYALLLAAVMYRARREDATAAHAAAGDPAAAAAPVSQPSAKKTRLMRIAYLVGLAVLGGLFVATPFVTGQATDVAVWFSLACIVLATPIFEEWLFRSYVWRRLAPAFGEGWGLVAVTAVLFGLWHLGYADVVAWQVVQHEALSSAPLWTHLAVKAGFGALMGAVLGAVRLRTGGWMAPALVHALWNLLA